MTVTPGTPSDFRAKKPPSLAIQITTSETVGNFWGKVVFLYHFENLYRVSGFDEISNACNPGYGGAVDDAFFESGNMS